MIIRCGHWYAELEGYYQSLRHGCHGAGFWGRENQWRKKSPVDTQRPQPPTVTVYLQARIRYLNTLQLPAGRLFSQYMNSKGQLSSCNDGWRSGSRAPRCEASI